MLTFQRSPFDSRSLLHLWQGLGQPSSLCDEGVEDELCLQHLHLTTELEETSAVEPVT